jgi:hypothetical protein
VVPDQVQPRPRHQRRQPLHEYAIQTSNDAVNWTSIYSTSNGVSWGRVTLANLTGRGRYVRMHGTQRATPWGYSLNEMQVWGY